MSTGKTLKIVIALVLIAGVSYWAFNTLRSSAYSGTNLNFTVGNGTVSLNNPSTETATVRILGTGTRPFRVISSTAALSGTSTRQGTESPAIQVFEAIIPQGMSEFAVTNGTNISAVVNSASAVEAIVPNLNETEARVVMIMAVLVILGSSLYILRSTQEMWMPLIRPVNTEILPVPINDNPQGDAVHAYGDNRRPKQI